MGKQYKLISFSWYIYHVKRSIIPVGPIRIVATFTKNSVLRQYELAATAITGQYWATVLAQ